MTDPQRLRDLADTLEGDDWQHPLGSADLCRAAADELERLRTLCELGIGREQLALSQEIVRLRAVISAYSDITAAYRLGLQPKGKSLDVVSEYRKKGGE